MSPQPQQTKPNISSERQEFLLSRLTILPNIEEGLYPFKDAELERSDVEWLLFQLTPTDGSNRLDLRGAILSKVDLSGLSLARIQGGLAFHEYRVATPEQCDMAGIHLEDADLSSAHLEEAILNFAHLENAQLVRTHLERAELVKAHLENAMMLEAHLEETKLVGHLPTPVVM